MAALACGGPPKEPERPTLANAKVPESSTPTDDVRTENDEDEEASNCPADMSQIPAGKLWLGSPDGKGEKDEHPQLQIEMDEFCLDKIEATVGAYKSCVENGLCEGPPDTVALEKMLDKGAREKRSAQCTARKTEDANDYPLNCVSHEEAVAFCKWKGRRLPTENELEYVATAGEDKLKYPWGDDPPNANVVCWSQKDGPCKVQTKQPASFEIYDLVGNLSEWTSTPYGPYGTTPSGEIYAVRGASWKTTKAEDARGKRRFKREFQVRDTDLGFRCAKD